MKRWGPATLLLLAACARASVERPPIAPMAIGAATGALPAVAAAAPTPLLFDVVSTNDDRLSVSYPVFHHPDAAVNAALSKLVMENAPGPGLCGQYWVEVKTATTELVSLVRSSMVQGCSRSESDTGGAIGGPTIDAFVFEIGQGKLRPLGFRDVMASPQKASAALKTYCEKELANPEYDPPRHEGACDRCTDIEVPDKWRFALTDTSMEFYAGDGSTCRILVPYRDLATWLSAAPAVSVWAATAAAQAEP